MNKVTVVFTRSKRLFAPFSWFIMLWTLKPFSHVAVRFYNEEYKTHEYYQASEGLVNYMSEVQFNKKHQIIESYNVNILPGVYSNIREHCHREAGADYGFLQNLGIMYVDIMNLLGKKVQNPFKKGRNCSELVFVYILKRLYPELAHNPNTIKPHHVERILKKKDYKTIKINKK